jgi:hypothetical protein
MNTSFRWQIISEDVVMEYEGYTDYIYNFVWKYIGENGSYSSFISGTTTFSTPSGTFIPFVDVTEQDKIRWLEQCNDVSIFQRQINIDIYNQQYTNTYRWYILGLETMPQFEGHQDFVTKVLYRYNVVNNLGFTADLQGQLTFNQAPNPYVEYANITEADVIIWLDTYSDKQQLQDNLTINLFQQMNPVIVSLPLPWEQ